MTFINIQIPLNAEVGDSLSFTVKGTDFEIPIPEGSQPGDILQIQVGDDINSINGIEEEYQDMIDDEDVDDNLKEEITSCQKYNHKKKRQSDQEQPNHNDYINVTTSSTSIESFTVPLHHSVQMTLEMQFLSSLLLNQNENNHRKKQKKVTSYNEDGTYAMVWPSAFHMTQYITSPNLQEVINRKKSIIELGSGLGVVGLSYSVAVAFASSPTKRNNEINIVLTDLPSALPQIQHNITYNKKRLLNNKKNNADRSNYNKNMFDNVSVEPLIWGDKNDSSTCSMLGKADLILASDILYDTKNETYNLLCDTISSLLKKNDYDNNQKHTCNSSAIKNNTMTKSYQCEILLAVRWRKPEEERKFFEILESKLGFQFEIAPGSMIMINNEEYNCDLDWREFGNPSCEMSNEYFTKTCTEVKGVSIPLKDITEDHINEMNEGEYQSFEARYIQIFVGYRKNLNSTFKEA